MPISVGGNSYTLMDFEQLVAAEAVDFVHPSVAKMGGISELLRVFPIRGCMQHQCDASLFL